MKKQILSILIFSLSLSNITSSTAYGSNSNTWESIQQKLNTFTNTCDSIGNVFLGIGTLTFAIALTIENYRLTKKDKYKEYRRYLSIKRKLRSNNESHTRKREAKTALS